MRVQSRPFRDHFAVVVSTLLLRIQFTVTWIETPIARKDAIFMNGFVS